METIRIIPPVKYLWRDSHKVLVDSVATFNRHLAQPFGVNWAPFSYKEVFGVDGHDGLDIAVPVGQPVLAAHDGYVVEADNTDDRDGLGVSLYDPKQDITTIYWHNSVNKVLLLQEVKAGDVIALSGGTGKAYGPHIHFGLYRGKAPGGILNRDNGYRGAIDPTPFLVMPDTHNDFMTGEFVFNFYLFFFGREPDAEELTYWKGKSYRALFEAALKGRFVNWTQSKK